MITRRLKIRKLSVCIFVRRCAFERTVVNVQDHLRVKIEDRHVEFKDEVADREIDARVHRKLETVERTHVDDGDRRAEVPADLLDDVLTRVPGFVVHADDLRLLEMRLQHAGDRL